jgi:ATP-dependent Lhr-like helicase
VLSHEILNARPYAFLDDAPLEERRTQAVYARRATEPSNAADLGALDPLAIDRVRAEQRIDPRDADELHDALLTIGFVTDAEIAEAALRLPAIEGHLRELSRTRRICRTQDIWITAERLPEIMAVHPGARPDPSVAPPASRNERRWTRDEAMVELLRGRMTLVGPTTSHALAQTLSVDAVEIESALLALESEGVVLRGCFSESEQWCERALLSRIHRYTLNRLRAEIEPVTAADFTRFLFRWQHAEPSAKLAGIDGLRAIVSILDGYEMAASGWEQAVLPQRLDRYEPSMLDTLCLAGEVGWARLSSARTPSGDLTTMVGTTPIALFLREHADAWRTLAQGTGDRPPVSEVGNQVLGFLHARGASFSRDIMSGCALPEHAVRPALAELAAAGLVASDGFAGLRAIVRNHTHLSDRAGRWSAIGRPAEPDATAVLQPATPAAGRAHSDSAAVEMQAWALLRRYGVVFRRLLTREACPTPWRSLTRAYRRLEARGEIRGGRFVTGMSGEQFALPDAVTNLREVRRTPRDGKLVAISAADPLNLTGILDSGDRVRTTPSNRVVYCDGVPVAALEGDYLRPLAGMTGIEPAVAATVATTLAGRPLPPITSGYVGRT